RSVKRSKPEPDLFLHAVEKMGWTAEDCLVIEDSVHGVTAGKAAGMIVCGFLGGAHIYPGHADKLLKAGADYLVSDIKNILRLI
ncbi:MAG: HAD family hydrolase, partial [Pseudobdellovibrionaceae bacterium]